ncbi:MAG: CDP-alcohol phosphatidyltransferase family protein, partial [Paraperlucidibaca sp.]
METALAARPLWNIPNILTVSRVALIPVLLVLAYSPIGYRNEIAAAVFAIAAVTDWFDGYLARTLNQGSAFGRFLDPVADKLMVAAALILLVEWHAHV